MRTTSAPRRASSIAAARPMPRVAPVSTTTVTQLTLPAPARLARTSWAAARCSARRTAQVFARPGHSRRWTSPLLERRPFTTRRGLSSHSNRPALAAATAPLSSQGHGAPSPGSQVKAIAPAAATGRANLASGPAASSASRTTPSRWEQSRRRARSRGAVCPIRVVLERPVSSYSVAPFVAEQERAADDPRTRATNLEPQVGSCFAGSNRKRRARPVAGSAVPRRPKGKRPALSIRASSGCTDRTHRGRGCCRGRPYRAGLPQTWRGERSGPLGVVPQLVLSTFSIATLHVPAFVGISSHRPAHATETRTPWCLGKQRCQQRRSRGARSCPKLGKSSPASRALLLGGKRTVR